MTNCDKEHCSQKAVKPVITNNDQRDGYVCADHTKRDLYSNVKALPAD